MTLQSMVLFRDGPFDYSLTFDPDIVQAIDSQTLRRIGYLADLSDAEVEERVRQQQRKERKPAPQAKQLGKTPS